MLTIRIAHMRDEHVSAVAVNLAARIQRHPATSVIAGTVLIGTGTADFLRPQDAIPRVIVPLIAAQRLTALGRAQLHQCQAVVVENADEASVAQNWMGAGALLVVATDTGSERGPFLRGATARDTAAAWGVVRGHSSLNDVLTASGVGENTSAEPADALVAAIIEAVVASTSPVQG